MSQQDHDTNLEQAVGMATLALREIASHSDCDYDDAPKDDRPRPCPCPKCVAGRTLKMIEGGWRYIGAHANRVDHSPRERKILESWKSQVDDKLLGMVLAETPAGHTFQQVVQPSVRDWYVATSVVQWLATNVGMEVLRRAGFEYKDWDEDRKERDSK